MMTGVGWYAYLILKRNNMTFSRDLQQYNFVASLLICFQMLIISVNYCFQ